MPSLNSGKKTQVTSVETAINTALSGLNPNDAADAEAIVVLHQMRKLLVHLTTSRTS